MRKVVGMIKFIWFKAVITLMKVQSTGQEKIPVAEWRLLRGAGGMFTTM
jgi:hypothetical protein